VFNSPWTKERDWSDHPAPSDCPRGCVLDTQNRQSMVGPCMHSDYSGGSSRARRPATLTTAMGRLWTGESHPTPCRRCGERASSRDHKLPGTAEISIFGV